jgi:hypothetical protein
VPAPMVAASAVPHPLAHAPAKMPLPAPPVGAAHAVPAPHSAAVDPAAMQETPAPALGMLRRGKPSNGVGAHAGAALPSGESDALSALNLGGEAARPAPAKLLSVAEVVTPWAGDKDGAAGRGGSTKMIVALLGVVAVIVVVVTLSMSKKASSVAGTTPGGGDPEAMGRMAESLAREKPGTVAPGAAPTAPGDEAPEPARGKSGGGHSHATAKSRPAPAHGGSVNTNAVAAAEDTAATANANRYRDTSVRSMQVPVVAPASRPPPNQGEISRVVNSNKIGIKTCYQRALLRDSSLTHGKITVRVGIGLSGRVKTVAVDGPLHFRVLEPCIKEMLARWVFPPASDEYGTEFSYVFQGNE